MEQLPGAGSNRTYYRFWDAEGDSLIGVVGTSREENEAFIYLAGHFGQKRLPMPRVVAVSTSRLCYLQTDLGHRSLFDALSEGREKGGRYASGFGGYSHAGSGSGSDRSGTGRDPRGWSRRERPNVRHCRERDLWVCGVRKM